MSAPTVLVLHDGNPPSGPSMRRIEELTQVQYTDEAQLAQHIPQADVLFAYHFTSAALSAVWEHAQRLKWIHVAAAGVDPFMTTSMRQSQVTITNSRGVFEQAIAEYVLGQVLSFAKDFPGSLRRQQEQHWDHRESERIAGTRAVVVGTGPIGRAIARLLSSANITVTGSGRRARTEDPDFGTVCAQEQLPDVVQHVDWVVCAAPLTEATQGMVNAELLAAMQSYARLINVGRGELLVTEDLVEALRTGRIAGAALDVVDPEPLPAQHPLWEMPQVMITPHNSGDFVGWREALVEVFEENLTNWVADRPLQNIVDKTLGYVPGS